MIMDHAGGGERGGGGAWSKLYLAQRKQTVIATAHAVHLKGGRRVAWHWPAKR